VSSHGSQYLAIDLEAERKYTKRQTGGDGQLLSHDFGIEIDSVGNSKQVRPKKMQKPIIRKGKVEDETVKEQNQTSGQTCR
jgi:hypothetical protein